MSTKHVRSAADLTRFKCALRIECSSCGNSTTMNGFEVAKAYDTKSFAEIRPRTIAFRRCLERIPISLDHSRTS